MRKNQLKIEHESTLLLKMDNQQILSYITSFGNQIMVCSHHMKTNTNSNSYDQHSTAYAVSLTSDGQSLLIFAKDPHSIHIIDIKSGDLIIARGLQQLLTVRIIAVALQPLSQIKPGSHTRKINIILENKGNIYFKVVQLQPPVDNYPKQRLKVIEESGQFKKGQFVADPIFSAVVWNNFILCRKQTLRVCRAVKKNEDVTFNFALQALQPTLYQLFERVQILAMAESVSTWAILCGNSFNSRTDEKMTVNIFQQHFQGVQLTKNMYFRDKCFIKIIELQSTYKNFVKFWFYNNCYIVQTIISNHNHQCHIIPQNPKANLITLQLLPNSDICYHSLTINNQEISICEIVNRKQLFKTKRFWKPAGQENISSNAISTTKISPNTQPQTNKNESKTVPNKKQVQTSIKQFTVVPQKKENEVKPPPNEQGKSTIKKLDNPFSKQKQQKAPQTKNISNKQPSTQLKESELQVVPEKLKRTFSFGTQDQMLTKPHLENKKDAKTALLQQPSSIIINNQLQKQNDQQKNAVGATDSTKTSPPPKLETPQPIKQKSAILPKQQKKQVPMISKQNAIKLVQTFSSLVQSMNQQLLKRQNELGGYSLIPITQSLQFQPAFSLSQSSQLLNLYKSFITYESTLFNNQNKKHIQIKTDLINKQKINKTIEKCQQLLRKFQVHCLEEFVEIKCLRKISKKSLHKSTVQSGVVRQIEQIELKVQQFEQKVQNMLKKTNQQLKKKQKQKNNGKKSLNLKEITKLLNGTYETHRKEGKFLTKMPIPRRQYIHKENPIIQLTPC